MKRNLDLIRNILLRIETNEKNATLSSSDFADLEPDQNIVDYHLYLWQMPDILTLMKSKQSGTTTRNTW